MGFWIWVGVMVMMTLSVPIASFIDKRGQPKPEVDEAPAEAVEGEAAPEGMAEEGEQMMIEEAPAEDNMFDFGGDGGQAGFGDDDFK